MCQYPSGGSDGVRLLNISSIANAFMPQFIQDFNQRFASLLVVSKGINLYAFLARNSHAFEKSYRPIQQSTKSKPIGLLMPYAMPRLLSAKMLLKRCSSCTMDVLWTILFFTNKPNNPRLCPAKRLIMSSQNPKPLINLPLIILGVNLTLNSFIWPIKGTSLLSFPGDISIWG